MAIIALAGQKGGTGKSTTSLALACELHERGRSVLIIDADQTLSASRFSERAHQAEYLMPTVMAKGADMGGPKQVPYLAQQFDFTIIDCPAQISKVEAAAVHISDVVILPYSPSGTEADAFPDSVELVKRIQDTRPRKRPLRAYLFLTSLVSGSVLAREAREAVKVFELPVLTSYFSFTVTFREYTFSGQAMRKFAPGTKADKQVRAFTDEIEALCGQKNQHNRRNQKS
jgi:chromosome partitioning protein